MALKTEATIYLADQRGCTQADWFRSYHTFNFGTYFQEHRKPFGSLQALNDETLKGGCTLKQRVQENTTILLIPIVGAVHYKNNSGIDQQIEVGQALIFFMAKDSEFEISNPYENELINFLQLRINTSLPPGKSSLGKFEFDLDQNKNRLIPIESNDAENKPHFFSTNIGKFGGREEATYQLENSGNSIFVFVIEGAFEVQNRLLHARDGLALANIEVVEFEALSNDAILLLIEQTN